MNILLETIKSLNKEEVRYFKIFSGRTHNEKNRKDITLFEAVKENLNSYDEDEIGRMMYQNKKNSFYQLKNNLVNSINKSIVAQHTSKEKDTSLYNIILLSRIYKRKGNLNLAYHYLKKAEKEAIKIEAFEILSIIYSEILKLSYDRISIDISIYTSLKIENKKKLDLSQDIDIALYSVMYTIKTTQNFSNNRDINLKKLENIINTITSKSDISKSPSFRIRLFEAISRMLLQENDFLALEEYLKKTYRDFLKKNVFNKSNHEKKLMMLSYMSNCLYKNRKTEESLLFAEKLKKGMAEFDGFLQNKFLFYYYNALVINYSKTNYKKALSVLDEAKQNEIIQELPTFTSFIYLNKSLIYYDQTKYEIAIKHISRVILQKDFINLSTHFQLKIMIAELIIRYHLKQMDIIEEKIKSIKKIYKEELLNNKRDYNILSIIIKLIYCNNIYTDKNLQSIIKSITSNKDKNSAEDTDVINYTNWLNSLMKN